MAQTLTKLAKFLRPIGKGHDEIVAIRLQHNTISLAEVQVKTNVIHLENLINLTLARPFDIKQVSRQSDMISESIRGLRDQGLLGARDAGIIIPSSMVTLRQFTLSYMTKAELAREGRAVDFWTELEPDIAKLEDPFVAYYELASLENDDLTRVVIGYCELAMLRRGRRSCSTHS
jgi:hypothetical protein